MFNRLVFIDHLEVPAGISQDFGRLTENLQVFRDDPQSEDEVIARIGESEGVCVTWRTPLSAAVLSACPNLRYIGLFAGAYTDPFKCNVDLATAQRLGIVVSTLGQYGDEATAEWVLAKMLSAARSTQPRWRGVVTELFGKRVGIIGMGHVGVHVAARASAFGMDVVYCAPRVKPAAESQGWKRVEREELLQTSDVVTIHVPTGVMAIDFEQFKSLRSDALLINTSLGSVLDVDGLACWLRNDLAAFACDACVVADQQAIAMDHSNAYIDTSIAGGSVEMSDRGCVQLLEGARAFLAGTPIRIHPVEKQASS